jgi:2-oxo-4-hydroxy-4-carboxy-5-ureidoimidazoline decarboxylase
MLFSDLNSLTPSEAATELAKCCGSKSWVEKMVKAMPFESEEALMRQAQNAWFACSRADWLEAFSEHPRLGDLNELEKKFTSTKEWSGQEQGAVTSATREVLEKFASLNKDYEKRYGYIFILLAAGKSAEEMLEVLKLRLKNNPYDEIKIATSEQNKITRSRLKKLLS